MPTSRGIVAAHCATVGHARRWPGLAMLVPGAPQWLWHQRDRAILLGGSYAAALGMGAFAWGTAVGAVLVAFAYAVHVASATDAITQWAFPGFGRRVPMVAAALALAAGIYGPLAVLGALVAWPGVESHGPRSEFAVDRLAYRGEGRTPGRGDYVWLAPRAAKSRGRLARVLARSGDEVAWSRSRLEVAGRRFPLAPFRPGEQPEALAFTVPDGHLLVAYRTDDPLAPLGWELVPAGRVEGRAWAQLYPIWERRLLN